MSKLKEYLDSKRKKTPLQEVLEKKLKKDQPAKAPVKNTPNQTPAQQQTKPAPAQQQTKPAPAQAPTDPIQQLLAEIQAIKQELQLVQTNFVQLQEAFQRQENQEENQDRSGEDEENQEEEENEDQEEMIQKKKTNIPDKTNSNESKKQIEGENQTESPFNYQEVLPTIFNKLRIPKENQELLVKIIKGEGQNLDTLKDEKELFSLLQTTVTQHPILARSTQYKPLQSNSSNQRAKNQDKSKMTMRERNQLFTKKLNEIV